MGDENNPPKPVSPEERRQAQLRHIAREREQKAKEIAAQLEIERGPTWALDVTDEHDPERIQAIVKVAAEIRAQELTEPWAVHYRDERGLVERAAKELERREQQAETAKQAESAAPPRQPGQESGTPIANAEPNAPGRNRQNGLYDELKRLSEQSPKELSPAPIVAAWRATADEVCDPKTPPPPPPRRATEPSAPPSPDQPPTPPSPNAAALSLSPDDVLQRFGNPALEAHYQQQAQQQQEREAKSPFSTPATAASVVARANAPAETPREDGGLMSVFVKAETKQKAEEEQAARANDPNKTLERSGRGR